LAAVATVRGHPRPAARLMGFAMTEHQPRALNDRIDRSSYNIMMISLLEQLPEEIIAGLRAEGTRLELEHALDDALELCGKLHS